jgi:hypothetical protein
MRSAGSVTGASIERERLSSLPSPMLRVVRIPKAGGGDAIKDPIYDLLEKSDSFSQLLYLRCLYVLGRTITLERPTLHRDLLKLYGTRNKLVHGNRVDLWLPSDFVLPGGWAHVADPAVTI